MSRQARSLDTLVAEVNRHAPKRSKASDGGLASPQHHRQNPTSDHEPNKAGVWRAYDFTHDPKHGLDGEDLAQHLASKLGHHPAMTSGAYVIWNRRIISCVRIKEGWRPYTYGDPHTGHVHVSVATAAKGYDSTEPWDLWKMETRVTRARALLQAALPHRGPRARAKIKAALADLAGVDE